MNCFVSFQTADVVSAVCGSVNVDGRGMLTTEQKMCFMTTLVECLRRNRYCHAGGSCTKPRIKKSSKKVAGRSDSPPPKRVALNELSTNPDALMSEVPMQEHTVNNNDTVASAHCSQFPVDDYSTVDDQ
jgi:hypothetical protein